MATTGLARVGFTATAAQTVFSFAGIDLLTGVAASAQLDVYVDGVLKTLTTHYTVDSVAETITFTAGNERTAGEVVTITRDTQDTARHVTFVNNSFIEASNLELNSNQLFFLLQENIDIISGVMVKNVAATAWEGQGLPANNFTAGTSATSLATVGQLDAAVAGVQSAELDAVAEWTFSGDNSNTTFTLTSPPQGLTDVSQVFVYISGVRQRPTADYTLDTTGSEPVLTFLSAPPTGSSNIYVLVISGSIVGATIPNGTVTTAMLATDAVTLAKMDAGTHDGTKTRFLKVLPDGTPEKTAISVSIIDGFESDLYSFRWSRMADPIAAVVMGGQKLSGLGTGTSGTDAVNKAQMDAAIAASISSDVGIFVGSGTSDGSGNITVTCPFTGADAFQLSYLDTGNNPQSYLFQNGTNWAGVTGSISGTTIGATGVKASTNFNLVVFKNS